MTESSGELEEKKLSERRCWVHLMIFYFCCPESCLYIHCKKGIPVPSRDVAKQTLPGRE
jgi:hypothetical protein